MHRDFSKVDSSVYELTPTGKKKHVINQRKEISKLHNIIIKANAALRDKNHYAAVVKESKKKKLL